jgi:hypothetical protein
MAATAPALSSDLVPCECRRDNSNLEIRQLGFSGQQRLPNDLKTILAALEPYPARLARGIAVESTVNWYWLADGLQGLEAFQPRERSCDAALRSPGEGEFMARQKRNDFDGRMMLFVDTNL